MNKKKYGILHLLLPLLGILLVYMLSTYISWEPNPSKWNPIGRLLSAAGMIFGIVCGIFTATDIYKDRE